MGISPDERHQEDPLAVPENVYITGVRLRNTAAAAPDQDNMAKDLLLDTPIKGKQSVLPFPVVKLARKSTQDAIPVAGALGVCIILRNCSL
jgi:hypothetical protein